MLAHGTGAPAPVQVQDTALGSVSPSTEIGQPSLFGGDRGAKPPPALTDGYISLRIPRIDLDDRQNRP